MGTRAIPASDWTNDQRAYIEWLATPSSLRSPDTELALSERLYLQPIMFKLWRRQPAFILAVRKAAREALGERYADVLRALEQEAINGSIQHLKVYLQLIGEDAINEAAPEPNIKVLAGVDLSRVGRAATRIPSSEG